MHNVIVTGGSRGLGLGIARRLASAGYRVLAIARKENAELIGAMQEAEERSAGSFHFIPFDLSVIEGIPAMVRDLQKGFGPIYGLVNNAGMSFDGSLALMRVEQIQELVNVNTISPIVLTKYVVRSMMADGGGRIINLASITAFTGYSGLSVYSATKSSLLGFSRSLAREVGRMNITVNSIAPGFIDTDMTKGIKDDLREKIERRSALGHLAKVDDVASAVEFLLSDGAKNMTGSVMTVDAGCIA